MRQDDLAAQMGVSKIPVREALQRLAALGLLRFEQHRGAVVPELTAADADEVFTLRRLVEVELLRRAVPLMTVVDIAAAEQTLDADADGDDVAGLGASWRFHRALYAPSGWARGIAMVEILHASVAPYVLLYTEQLGGARDSDDDHHELLDACRRVDSDAAASVLERHLDRAATTVLGFLGKDGHDD